MALSSGTRLGPYEIQQPLGAGGMGEVYRARDTRLDRSVAIKVLAPAIAADPAARARFEREARAVAALDHPHICGIHDVGEANGTHYLVMPLIEGQTLAARLEKGPLPLDQALTVAAQVADALDKAHRQGIVHRDLKPANIMLTKAGATLLDFGLAKLRGHSGPLALSGIERLATTSPGTAEGTILGTVQYMAPEQVEGREADARADIWALGAVSYEMVTGMRAFTGETPASVIGAILRDEPQPVSKRQPLAPAALDHLVSGALEKDPQERWQSAADVARELRWIQGQRRDVGQAAASHSRSRISSGGWVIALLSLAFLAFQSFRPGPQPLAETIRFDIAPPAGAAFSMLGDTAAAWPVVSPDGSRIVFPAAVSGSPAQLWVRRLDSTETIALQGTEDASFPFWAPDSRRVGFFAGKKLKSVDLFGGTPVALADVATGAQSRGGTWNRDGTILFTPAQVSGLWTVNENGSGLTKVTELDVAAGETSHRWPVFLPDGRHFLYTIRSSEPTQGIYVGSVNEVIRKRLVGDLSNAAVDPAGYMLFARSGALVAQAFDFDTLELSGPSVPVVPRVAFSPSYYNGAFSVSATGVLAYGPGAAPTQLQWMNRSGSTLTRVGTPGDYLHPRPSPDDARIAVARLDSQLSTWDLWLIDASRSDSMDRFTYGPSSERFPVWSPDGEQLAFSAQGARGLSDILVKAVSGAGDEHPFAGVTAGDRITNFAYDWAADGKTLIFVAQRLETAWDIDTLDVQSGKVSSFLATPFVEVEPQLSFDRRWFAYSSDESGRFEVYVRPFPNGDGKWKVSTTGGRQARWRADGRELFYLAPDGTVMATPIAASARFEAGLPAALFKASVAELAPQFGRDYAVSRDGQRILINWMAEEGAHATIVTNWSAAIGSRQSPVGSR